jgi:hypothetical protein
MSRFGEGEAGDVSSCRDVVKYSQVRSLADHFDALRDDVNDAVTS